MEMLPGFGGPIKKGIGVTPAERYLADLCTKSFLSLWSYPGIYRAPNKELADLLVVFERDILIFSDKYCELPSGADLSVAWDRWFRRAVLDSARQAWRAENWIKQYPNKLYLDAKCQQPFPYELPVKEDMRFHLIVVAHGISKHCKQAMGGGSGSLILSSSPQTEVSTPFWVGDIDKTKTFVHVLDDTSLSIIMETLDTIADFTSYLRKKERFFRTSEKSVLATGEEELLAHYLKNIGPDGGHDFVFPDKYNGIALEEGHWLAFKDNPQRLAQIEADKVSYVWDSLIERFNYYALRGEQYRVSSGGLRDSERILRFLAREPRFMRRVLGQAMIELLSRTPPTQRMIRVMPPYRSGDPYFVILLFPHRPDKSEEENREVRGKYLEVCCRVVKLKYPDATDIIGIATESGLESPQRSEDSIYLDARVWSEEANTETAELQQQLGILVNPTETRVSMREYPDVPVGRPDAKKYPRNSLCFCGSRRKYKHCGLNNTGEHQLFMQATGRT